MSRGNGISLIPAALVLALLLAALPVSADNTTANVTVSQTIVTPVPANVTTVLTTVVPATENVTAVATTTAPATTNSTPSPTTPAPVTTTAAVNLTTTAAPTVQPTAPVTTRVTTGSVNVYSSPPGASILIDGVYAGTTPKVITGMPAGTHILRLTLSGYYDYEGSIYVVPGQEAQGYGTLQPLHQVTAAPTPSGVVTVIIPVLPVTTEPADNGGLLGNSGVIAAIIGAIAVIIGAGVKIFTHVSPPKKGE